VLGVKGHLAALLDHVADRVADDAEVLFQGGVQHLGDVAVPALAHHRHHGRAAIHQGADVGVVLGLGAGAAGHAEGDHLGVAQRQLAHLLEIGGVAGVGPRPAALDIINAELVQLGGDVELVVHREGDALALRAIAQCGIIDLDMCHASTSAQCR